MSATDLLYYDMTPSPHGRSGRRRTKVVTVAARPHAQQQAEMKELGIGTRSCFSFRVPRTITTSDMSEGDVSQSQLHQPDYERLEKRGLLQSMKNSPSSQTTASMTATPVSSPESDGNFSSSTRGSLLAMPTPIDRSHKRRLQMERGLGNTYDGEQEPAGYRGQEASSERKPNRVEVSMTATTDRSRHTRAVDRRMRVANDGEMEAVQHNSSNRSDTAKSAPTTPVHLLAMPTPQDRSHRRRLEMERQGTGYTYDGEQEPAGYRGQHSNVPMAVSTELSATIPSAHRQSSRSQHLRRRVEPDRPTDDDGDDVVAHLFSETDMILDNVIRNSRSRRQTHIHEGHEMPAGSPYLQFSPEGPAIRGFEPSRQRNKLASSNSSLAISENASITSDEHIRLMVSDLVPLSPSSEEEAMSRVSTTAKLSIHKSEQLSMKPTLRTPTRSRDYGTETTDASSTSATSDPPKRFRKMQEDAQQVTPERRALAILRSGSQDSSLYSSSTHSSENLRSMMGDLLLDAGDNPSLPSQIGKHSKLPDANQMAVAAQNHVEQGEYDIALVLLGRVLDIYQKQHGARHPLVASAYHNLGMVHAQRADILLEGTLQQTHVRQQSLECFQRAARTARDSLGKNHPNVAVSLVKIGFLLLQARQFNPALITFEEALRIRTVHYASNPHHPLIANLHNNIGVAHLHLQNFSESKDSLTRALNIQRHNLRVKRMKCTREDLRARLLEVADTLANLGGLGLEWLRQDGTNEIVMWEAESHLAESLEIRSTVLGHQHPLSLQVKSLHDMVRTNSSLMPQEIGPTFRCNQTPNKSRKVAIHTDLSTREPESFGISRNLPASPSTATSGSPGRSIKVAQDAPAPKADSSSPLLELIAQSIAARKLRSKDVLSQPVKPLSRGARVGTRAVAPPRPLDAASTVSDVAPTDEDDSLLNDPPKRRRSRTLEKTKIYIEPHYIPRQSPTRKSSSPDGSFVSDTRTPVAPSSSESDSSLGRQSSSHAYDAEESCLINGSGDRVDLLSSFLVRGGDDDDDGVNLSSHEIMVVRPSASVPSRDTLGQLVQPLAQTMRGRWTGDARRKPLSPPRGGVDKEFEENDEGIAPLSRHHFAIIDQKVRLSKGMLENPERHLSDIHVVASRYLKKNRLQEAKHLFMAVLECQRRIRGELHEDVGAALHNVGLVHLRLNEHTQALDYFELAVRVRKGSLGRDHPEVAVSQVKVGISLLLLHQFDRALQAFLEALSIRKRALGALHPSLSRVYNNIACVHVEFNELREARRAFEAALDIQRNALCHEPDSGPLMFGTATTLCNLGYLYRYREMHQKAALVLKEALSLQEGVLGQTHPTVITTMDSLADALSSSGGCSQGLQYYEEILSRLESIEDASNRRQAEAVILYKMSRAHRKQNDVEAEVDKLEKALLAIRATEVNTTSEGRRKELLERQILTDIRGSLGELKKMRLR